ncbi:chemotaxis protein CheX [Bacillus ectoiniformans]|uniref:chemotaxis protein CheX n=1 Tax=Bacillus ectoiniformans TaxID=1494429 RepID=UPI001958FC4B|nr:chemotaxis protein CheX [Bacillus ectoiniformans]MBM7647937.1 chemotaxis protein CheX [Bacillus ectoiniformans]
MSTNATITSTLNSVIEVIKSVIPVPVTVGSPSLTQEPFQHESIGVFVGITGDLPGRLMIEGSAEGFGKLGSVMFGMPIEGEMIESFSGELGNMVAGNLGSNLFQKGITIDITPPTIIVGNSKLYGFKKAIQLPIKFENAGEFLIVLNIENQE